MDVLFDVSRRFIITKRTGKKTPWEPGHTRDTPHTGVARAGIRPVPDVTLYHVMRPCVRHVSYRSHVVDKFKYNLYKTSTRFVLF